MAEENSDGSEAALKLVSGLRQMTDGRQRSSVEGLSLTPLDLGQRTPRHAIFGHFNRFYLLL